MERYLFNEATSDSSVGGSYISPLVPGIRKFKDINTAPFTDQVSKFNSAELEYDSYDGKMSNSKKQIKKKERRATKYTNMIKNNPDIIANDDDGGIINALPRKKVDALPLKEWVDLHSIRIDEISSSTTSGMYNGPQELGLKKWKKYELGPFDDEVDMEFNHVGKQKKLKGNVNRVVGVWEKGSDGTYNMDTYDVDTINEDLAVWFGKKKKPKGSKQPQGPWVNICRKKEGGGHPPCGRAEGESKAYPKCRALGVARRMTDAQKRSACQQKRKAEKQDTQVGKGQKPIMTSYKPKKTQKESIDIIVRNILSSL